MTTMGSKKRLKRTRVILQQVEAEGIASVRLKVISMTETMIVEVGLPSSGPFLKIVLDIDNVGV